MREKRQAPPPLPEERPPERSPRPDPARAEPSHALLESPDRARRKRSAKAEPEPFPWASFDRLGREDLAALLHLESYLPHPALRHGLARAVSERLGELLGGEVSFWLDYAHVVSGAELRKIVDAPSVLALVSASPHGPRGLIEIELGLAQGAIDLLLGVGGSPGGLQPLTEIEEGVVSYLVLEALRAAQGKWGEGAQLRLKLTGIAPSLDGAREVLAEEKRFAVLELKVAADVHAGYVRLVLPWALVEKHKGVASPRELAPAAHEAWLEWARENLQRVAGARVPLAARIGRTELTGAELAGVGVGDVVLVEDLTLSPDLRGGRAHLYAGRGRSARAVAKLVDAPGHYGLQIEKLERTEEPRMTPKRNDPELRTNPGVPQSAGGAGPEPDGTHMENLRETEGFLPDVPVTVTIELGRIELGADEVLALRTGQVVTLDRGPGDPVDLVANGRLIARGELVHVEGQVGVRVVKLVR